MLGSHFLDCLMSPFACLPQKSKLDTPVYMGNLLFLPRVHITTFVIFNMVPVGPGLGSNYGLRVIHILWALSLSLTSASGRRQSTLCVRGQFITRRERIAWTQTLQLKLPIWSVINVTLSVHKDEYKTVSLRTISVCMNAPCGLTRLRKWRIFSVCKSAVRVCEENVVFDRRHGCVSSPI